MRKPGRKPTQRTRETTRRWRRPRSIRAAAVAPTAILVTLGLAASSLLVISSSLAVPSAGAQPRSREAQATAGRSTTTPPTDEASLDGILGSLKKEVATDERELEQLKKEADAGGSVSPAVMLQLQFQMQQMSQYIEAVSNTLSAIHQEMMSMARATKGR
jgi:hypothetical protein